MRVFLIGLLLALGLAACSTYDDSTPEGRFWNDSDAHQQSDDIIDLIDLFAPGIAEY